MPREQEPMGRSSNNKPKPPSDWNYDKPQSGTGHIVLFIAMVLSIGIIIAVIMATHLP